MRVACRSLFWSMFACLLFCASTCADDSAAQWLVDAAKRQNLQLVVAMTASLAGKPPATNAAELPTLFDAAKTYGLHVQVKGDLAVLSRKAKGDVNQLGQSLTLQAAKKTMSCELLNVNIRDLFRMVHQNTGLNLLWHKSMIGRVIVRVQEIEAGLLVEAVAHSYGYAVKQQGNIVFIDHPARIAEMAPLVDFKGGGDVSIDFRDADIRDVANVIASRAKNDFVTGANVRGNISVSLSDVSVEEAMIGVASMNGFGAVLVDGLWILADPRELVGLVETWKQIDYGPTANISLDFRDVGIQQLVQLVSDKVGLPYPALLHPESRVTVRFQDRSATRIRNLLIKLGGGTL